MRRVRIILIQLVLLGLSMTLNGQGSLFPYCKRHYSSEKNISLLFEDLYYRSTQAVNNADLENLEQLAIDMKSIADISYPLTYGLLESQEGVINYYKEDYSEALKHLLKALSVFSDEKYYTGINSVYNNIAIIFAIVGDYQSSKEYLNRAIELNEEQNLNYYALFSYNLANVELQLNNYESTIRILKELFWDTELSLDPISPVSIVATIISSYNKLQMFKESESWINRGYLALDENDHSTVDILTFYTSVMEYHIFRQEYEKVLDISERFKIDERYILPDSHDHLEYLCRAYSEMGNYEKAWKYAEILNNLTSHNTSINREEIINMLMVEYQETRNQRLQEAINQEIILNQASHEASHKLLITMIVVLLMLMVLALSMHRIYSVRSKYRKAFRKETHKFATVNRELQKTNKELEKENRLLDTFISVLAHDLINPFQAILGFSRLMVDDFETIEKDNMIEYCNMLNETSFQLNQLLTNLQSIANIQGDKEQLTISVNNVKEILDNVAVLYKPLADRKKIKIKSTIDSSHNVLINQEIFESVLRNVLNNALKYSNVNGEIRIHSLNKGEFIDIIIEDDGVGMDDELVNKILDESNLLSSPGTSSEKGSGLGLAISIDFLKLNNGKLDIDNSRDKGVSVILSIPNANV